MKLPLSVAIISHNEEEHIGSCLSSVSDWVQEMVVVDSGSTDKTVGIATQEGAKVYFNQWQGFGPQKRQAVLFANHDWILALDADERVSESLQNEIKLRFSTLDPKILYKIPRKSYFLGRWINHGGWYPDYQGRLFNKNYYQWNASLVHEKVVFTEGHEEVLHTTGLFKFNLEHFVFSDLKDQIVTNIKYAQILAENEFNKKSKFYLVGLLVRPFGKFIECYFIKGGFLDGLPGFLIAINAAYSMFMRWGFRWELAKSKSKQKVEKK